MTQYEIGCIILSSASIVISIGVLLKDIFLWKKNKLTLKNLIVDIPHIENQGGSDDWIYTTISITNKTNKEFTISDIQIIAHNLNCKIWQSVNDVYGEPTQHVAQLTEIRLHAHETVKIDLFIVIKPISENTPAVLSLTTPYGKFEYPTVLPKGECSYNYGESIKKDK